MLDYSISEWFIFLNEPNINQRKVHLESEVLCTLPSYSYSLLKKYSGDIYEVPTMHYKILGSLVQNNAFVVQLLMSY